MRRLALASTLAITAASVLFACGGEAPPPVYVPPVTTATPPPLPSVPELALKDTGIEPAWLDTTADPCQDFFVYSCGGFVKSTVIPADRPTWGATEEVQEKNLAFLHAALEKARTDPEPGTKKIGDFYAACMDEDAIEKAGATPLAPLLAPVAQVKDFRTLAEALTKLHAAGTFPFFDVDASQDLKDATREIGVLDQDGLGLPDRDYYLKDDGNQKSVREFYEGHIGRLFALTGMKPGAVKAATADVMRIETKLARAQQDKVARRDPYKIYHRVDRAGLAKLAKSFPWDEYFKGLGFPELQEISVNDPGYFTAVEALMQKEPPAAVRHYLAWTVIRTHARMLSMPFVEEDFAMRKELWGVKELEPRWKRCVKRVDDSLGELLAQPYVAAKFGGDSKERARALVASIHLAMKSELETLPWMDADTRSAALAKLGKITDKVGYPDTWRTYDFDVTRASHAANVIAADRFELHRHLAKVGKPVDRNEWQMTPPTVNAYYDPSMNEIALPAGQLQPPFFSRDSYAPVNIGDIGANTVGHELTHGFDDEGSLFDGQGNLRDWWTPATKAKFVEATRCVQDQYSGYEAVPGMKLNGELTSGENIADIGGVKLGYAALVAWKKANPGEHRRVAGYTDEQLFFLGYAQGWCSKETPEFLETLARTNAHSPPRWRVNGPMSDVPAFADAFQCKAETPMRPAKVCSVW